MEHLLLVDGSNLLFQMFYGMPSRILAPDGRPVHGTLGFAGALLRSARALRPTHALVVFDGECQNPRAALDRLSGIAERLARSTRRTRPTGRTFPPCRSGKRPFPSFRTSMPCSTSSA